MKILNQLVSFFVPFPVKEVLTALKRFSALFSVCLLLCGAVSCATQG